MGISVVQSVDCHVNAIKLYDLKPQLPVNVKKKKKLIYVKGVNYMFENVYLLLLLVGILIARTVKMWERWPHR